MNFDPCPDKCEQAFLGFVQSENPLALFGYPIVSSKRHADFPIPGVVFAVSEDAVKERLHGRGVFEVPLDIYVGTNSEQDPEGSAHRAAAGAIIGHLNDKTSVRAVLNTAGNPDTRPVKDFHVYDYSLRGQPTRAIALGTWETVIKLLVICQGMDAP